MIKQKGIFKKFKSPRYLSGDSGDRARWKLPGPGAMPVKRSHARALFEKTN